MTRFDSSSSITSSRRGKRSTSTAPLGWNVIALTPPYAEMYWSCLPMGSFRMSISSWHASRASCSTGTNSRLYACRPFISATVKLLDEPALRVREADRVLEPPRDADEDELVDRGGDHEPPMIAGIAWQVCPSPAEGEAHRRAGDDHALALVLR